MSKPLGFADLLEEAQKTPNSGPGGRGDIASPFPFKEKIVNLDDDETGMKIAGITEFEYTPHNEVLNLGREEDRDKYNAVLTEALAGRAIIRTEEGTFTKEGDRLLALTWLVKKVNMKKVNARKKREDDEDREDLIDND